MGGIKYLKLLFLKVMHQQVEDMHIGVSLIFIQCGKHICISIFIEQRYLLPELFDRLLASRSIKLTHVETA